MQHAQGLGAPNSDQVRQRAVELARIAGREDFSDEDWREAKRELHGGHGHTISEDEAEMVTLVSEHDMVVTDLGHHVENIGLEDADNVVEELIAEGMDEAVHEQMLAARREEENDGEEYKEEEDEDKE
jgi:hypothetical protein